MLADCERGEVQLVLAKARPAIGYNRGIGNQDIPGELIKKWTWYGRTRCPASALSKFPLRRTRRLDRGSPRRIHVHAVPKSANIRMIHRRH